ncbi:hypothetical protein FSP39_011946 [Pinctada imbricata]|uniref:Profilin n=1 Tax=Pinctada imbricata TaxID=66713 RepID=A0AA89BWX5_PINIB|nr:hypothetical protein FSP39_011946 [Pinctada imbricata]
MHSWKDLFHILTRNGKIERALILDSVGNVVISSSGLDASQKDVNVIYNTLNLRLRTLTKIKFCGNVYICFKHNDEKDTFMGKSGEFILVAHRANDVTVVGIAHSTTPGSCLYEVTSFCERMSRIRKRSRLT